MREGLEFSLAGPVIGLSVEIISLIWLRLFQRSHKTLPVTQIAIISPMLFRALTKSSADPPNPCAKRSASQRSEKTQDRKSIRNNLIFVFDSLRLFSNVN